MKLLLQFRKGKKNLVIVVVESGSVNPYGNFIIQIWNKENWGKNERLRTSPVPRKESERARAPSRCCTCMSDERDDSALMMDLGVLYLIFMKSSAGRKSVGDSTFWICTIVLIFLNKINNGWLWNSMTMNGQQVVRFSPLGIFTLVF
jgi:hypothetical protein